MILLILIFFLIAFFFLGFPKEDENLIWGVNLSPKHSRLMGLDFEELYLSIIDDLKVDIIKLAVHWDEIEKEDGKYNFEKLDFIIEMAEDRGVKIILVLGIKTSRWPECHIPYWAESLSKEKQQERILKKIESVILRYKDSKSIKAWQIENEPFFDFGHCPWEDRNFLKKEVELARSLDKRPIIVSETGEFSFWFKAARIADIVGVTMYRVVWFGEINRHVRYPIPATFYRRRAKIINWFFNKEVIGVELQAEPWGESLLYDSPLEEQEKSMNIEQLRKNIQFAKKVGFRENYLWGVEWWYYMKTEEGNSQFWEEAKKLWIKYQ